MFVTFSNFELEPYKLTNLDRFENMYLERAELSEDEALLKLLGRQLYTAFLDALDEMPDAWLDSFETVIGTEYTYGNDIWEALTITEGTVPVEGADWTLVEENNIWLKLKNGADYTYASKTWKWLGMAKLMTPKVYSDLLAQNEEMFTGIGMASSTPENSLKVSPAKKICDCHNAYSKIFGILANGCMTYEDSLIGFLTANSTDYPDWYFENPGKMNTFGI